VILRASSNGKRVAAQWTTATKCGRGAVDTFVNFTPPTKLRADGTFSRSERFSVQYADLFIRYRASFSGRIRSDGATGTLRLRTRVYNGSGTKLRTKCDSGGRTWIANPA
jgi:hypothetical protein